MRGVTLTILADMQRNTQLCSHKYSCYSSFKFFTMNYIHLSTLRPTHDPTVRGLMMNDRSLDIIVIEPRMSRIVGVALLRVLAANVMLECEI
jgi:hypothetical protein